VFQSSFCIAGKSNLIKYEQVRIIYVYLQEEDAVDTRRYCGGINQLDRRAKRK